MKDIMNMLIVKRSPKVNKQANFAVPFSLLYRDKVKQVNSVCGKCYAIKANPILPSVKMPRIAFQKSAGILLFGDYYPGILDT